VDQYNQYESAYSIFVADPATTDSATIETLREHIDFIAHVADCYRDLASTFPSDLISLLNSHHQELEPELREKVVGSLVLLRNKDVISSVTYIRSRFPGVEQY
jgi:protein SDA1